MDNKKVYFIGDTNSNTGPAIVNNYYKTYLNSKFSFSLKIDNKVHRILNYSVNIKNSDLVIFSGSSFSDLYLITLCKVLRKKIIYIMHGCMEIENKINKKESKLQILLEKKYLKYANLVLCVSNQFSTWLIEKYPQYSDKIMTLTNGIDWDKMPLNKMENSCSINLLSSIGGGVPRKNVKTLCKSIKKINEMTDYRFTLEVFGRDDLDTEEIKKYDFVHYYGKIDRDKMLRQISCTNLFIQNSVFDTFAMAPIEALSVGCSILCSKNVGALSLFDNLLENDVIDDCFDVDEIASKIIYLVKNPNNKRLLSQLDKQKTSFEYRAQELEKYVNTIMNEEYYE